MSYYELYKKYKDYDFDSYLKKITDEHVIRSIRKENLNEIDYLVLLSRKAGKHIEEMAQRSKEITSKYFGKVIFLYSPLYLCNYCENECLYCGFKHSNKVQRKKLTSGEIEKEAEAIAKTGIKHLLILTGESNEHSPVSYIIECVKLLRKYFDSISIEIYPLTEEEYGKLIAEGVDGITIYQETYDEMLYKKLHLKGPKSDYKYRLDTPERACLAGMRTVTIGNLLGLSNFERDAFFTGMHANYLQSKYSSAEISVSLPRLRPETGGFIPLTEITDSDVCQMLFALRIYLPRAGINISTRERMSFRDNLIGLGATRMSAGSKTEVGGYSLNEATEGQFFVNDDRSVEEIKQTIYSKGYQPVFKDWHTISK